VAEFVRLHRVAAGHGLRLNFEDDLMDLTLYEGDTLVVCVEARSEPISSGASSRAPVGTSPT
jgi:hypothetical protein